MAQPTLTVRTHVGGTAAANTNNSTGVAGVGHDASLMSGKVLGDYRGGSAAWLANGITWAADNGAKVANFSIWADGFHACPKCSRMRPTTPGQGRRAGLDRR